jgi:hypothetical protein
MEVEDFIRMLLAPYDMAPKGGCLLHYHCTVHCLEIELNCHTCMSDVR